jgi:hypothetical protein
MESSDGQRQLICESCGASFSCYPWPGSNCWCGSVTISGEALADLKAKFGQCICPECLAKYAQKVQVERG